MQWYEGEVRVLERACAGRFSGDRPPAFYGSSSIRLWDTLAEDFDPRVLNLGFGGSTLEACDYFFARLVPPVKPRSLLLYAGKFCQRHKLLLGSNWVTRHCHPIEKRRLELTSN